MSNNTRAIIHIETSGKNFSRVNYSRRMYAVIRKYTPDVAEGTMNECYADLTGLRTFYKMTYKEIAGMILGDLKREIGIPFTIRASTVKAYEEAKYQNKRPRSISTYKELNKFFNTSFFTPQPEKKTRSFALKRKKLTVPFLGKVS